MKFGEYIRLKRLELEMSLRKLANLTGIDVAYLSRIEGDSSPPQKAEILDKLVSALQLGKTDARRLKDLAAIQNKDIPEDIEIKPENYESIPVLLRTISNKKLSPEQIMELARRINRGNEQ
jgi:transcriptional regulator with XRE-family HTH domain